MRVRFAASPFRTGGGKRHFADPLVRYITALSFAYP